MYLCVQAGHCALSIVGLSSSRSLFTCAHSLILSIFCRCGYLLIMTTENMAHWLASRRYSSSFDLHAGCVLFHDIFYEFATRTLTFLIHRSSSHSGASVLHNTCLQHVHRSLRHRRTGRKSKCSSSRGRRQHHNRPCFFLIKRRILFVEVKRCLQEGWSPGCCGHDRCMIRPLIAMQRACVCR
jgi:hypothetical protein